MQNPTKYKQRNIDYLYRQTNQPSRYFADNGCMMYYFNRFTTNLQSSGITIDP